MTAPRNRRSRWYWLLLVPVVALAFPVVYAKNDPTLFGFPFFYWYQFAWLFGSSAITWIVYRATR